MDEKYLHSIEEVIKSLDILFAKAGSIIQGGLIFVNDFSLNRKETKFAEWYYGEGQIFSSFDAFKALETSYNSFFDAYENFYTYLHVDFKKKGLFSSKNKKHKKLSELYGKLKEEKDLLSAKLIYFKNRLVKSQLYSIHEVTPVKQTTEKPAIDWKQEVKPEIAPQQPETEPPDTLSDSSVRQDDDKGDDDDGYDIDEEIRRILS